ESLKGSGESIFALNILGKSLMVLRQFEAALKCFQKAQSMSPLNLERLVMIAESQAEVGESEVAKDTIAKAKDIDPESPIVQEGEVRVAVSSGDSDSAKKMLGQIEGVGNVISYLNNKAVAHAKCGLNDEGIDIYKKTLNAVPDDRVDTRAVVIYNMALAKIRRNDLADALVDLEEIIKHSETKVTKKAQSLKKRLEAAVGSNTGIALREADQNSHQQMSSTPESPTHDESQAADETTIVSTVVQSSPGEQCCYLVFRSSAEVQEPLKKLLSTPPRFKMRKPIERGETFMGADANRGGKAS
ncbi:MAG: hypothetical protein NTV34_07510, partial [Proteobacteria bacterium]|nr:hypothetical protein [Pseudomonadota bacterium]